MHSRIAISQCSQNFDLPSLHYRSIGIILMIVALKMQDAMHGKMGVMRCQDFYVADCASFSITGAHSTMSPAKRPVIAINESQHVGSIILPAKIPVETAAFGFINDT